jgi:hypothetical protein
MCFLIVLFVALSPDDNFTSSLSFRIFNFEHAFEKKNYDHEIRLFLVPSPSPPAYSNTRKF